MNKNSVLDRSNDALMGASGAKVRIRTRELKKHLKYMIPQLRLALIKEPGAEPVSISRPTDLERFVQPLKHYADPMCQ